MNASTGRRRQRLMRYGLVVFSLLSVLGVVAISATINGQPDLSAYPGWVTVLEPVEQETKDRVGLMVFALDAGGRGERPRLVYSVSVCGPDRFRGVLLAGGQARLSNDPDDAAVGTSNDPRPSTLPRLTLGSESSGDELALGAAQSLKLDFRRPPPCADEFKPEQALNFFGEAARIVGRAHAPVRRSWSGPFGLWSGPREGSSWPLIGTLPGIPSGEVGVFDGVEGLAGKWKIPVLFGIGGSVLAALALDATRGRSAQLQQHRRAAGRGAAVAGSRDTHSAQSQAALTLPPDTTDPARDRRLLPVLVGAGVALVLLRLLGRRRG